MTREGSTHRSRRPNRDDLLADILEYGAKAKAAVGNRTVEAFVADDLIYDAALLRLQNVSEATTQLLVADPDVQERHPNMPWTQIKGIGNVIRHAYHGIDAEVIWSTITGPALASLMEVAHIELYGTVI